jgi:glycosyltransferase involved in cell wall biosynthesis
VTRERKLTPAFAVTSMMTASGHLDPSNGAAHPAGDPCVDLGMPAYRRTEFIGEAIESVLTQTYSNWRLVVSENGPGGGELEAAVAPYTSDPRIRFVTTGENLGPAANWTRVLQAGTAPYFSVIQDDDLWDPGFLARRVAFLEAHRACGFVYSGDRQIDRHGRPIASEKTRSLQTHNVADVLTDGVYPSREYILSMYRNKLGGIHTPALCSVGVMSRRTALDAVGPYFDGAYPFVSFDVHLYLRMALRFPVGFIAVKDAAQRIHDASITSGLQCYDGEYFVRFQAYHRHWFTRELPGLELPRQYDDLVVDAHAIAALDALERGDRTGCARHVRTALRRRPSAFVKPRLAASIAGMALGRRGPAVLGRARDTRRRGAGELIYERQRRPADAVAAGSGTP